MRLGRLALAALGVAVLAGPSAANPNNAGTLCSAAQMGDMTGSAHGAATTGDGGYTMSVAELASLPGFFNITLAAATQFKGLLVYASDGASYIGTFYEYPSTLSVKADCGATDESVLEHNSPDLKSSVSLTWSPQSVVPPDGTEIQIYAVVLQSMNVWYNLPPAVFKYTAPANNATPTGQETDASITATISDSLTPTDSTAAPTATLPPDASTTTPDPSLTPTDAPTDVPTVTPDPTEGPTTTKTYPTDVPENLKNLKGIAVKLDPMLSKLERKVEVGQLRVVEVRIEKGDSIEKRDSERASGKGWLRRRWFA